MSLKKYIKNTLFIFAIIFTLHVSAQDINHSEFKDLSSIKNVTVDLRYASLNNFMGENLYGNFNKAYLHPIAAEKLNNASKILNKKKPGWKFIIFDALRPLSVQKKLFAKVKGTDKEKYVANPEFGSIHNFGFAVDIGLLDEMGREVDMGTPYDDFTLLAQPVLEDQFLKAGKLTEIQIKNRKVLRSAMEESGFKQLSIEWWHFDALPATEVRKNYKIVN
ncbi:MAG: M15 family metallopeptidase [Spirochaetia bacterium]|nr:M15 family metallopeptidase [Spirochaetia bacterium]